MAKKFLTPVDLVQNELQNARIQNLASAPTSPAPVKGQMYFNTSDNTFYWFDGTGWVAAKAPSTSGITQGEADARYVALAGSTMTGLLTLVSDPSSALHAATKQYVDNMSAGLSWKDSVRAATTANITLSAPQTIDGVAVIANDRVLVKNQSTASANGIYDVKAGAWTRSTDADSTGEMDGAAIFVMEGTTQADTAWTCTTNAPITIGSTALVFAQFGAGATYTAGAGLTAAGNTFDVGAGTGITVAADSVSITPAGVTNALLATMPTLTIKGNATGSTAAPTDLTAAQTKSLLAIANTDVSGLGSLATKSTIVSTDITDGAVANGDLATMPANTVKMNNTGGVASPTDVTIANLLTALGLSVPVTVAQGGTGRATATTAYGLIAAGTTATGVQQTVTPAASGFLKTTSATALPAWTAITTADITGLDNALLARPSKYTQATIGGATSQVVTHNLNTQACVVNVYRTATPWDTVECDIERTTVNTITLRFAVAPATNEYSVVVVG